ncbi:hypothetical protein EON62_01530 [archaeon]|nr:MAG: hypothetical protein EON62_01530 [archaeon]
MKKFFLLITAGASLALSSCSIALPVAISSNPIGSKVGTASADIYLGVFSFDADASIRSAAKQGGITRVSTVDIKQFTVLFLYTKVTTTVTGE